MLILSSNCWDSTGFLKISDSLISGNKLNNSLTASKADTKSIFTLGFITLNLEYNLIPFIPGIRISIITKSYKYGFVVEKSLRTSHGFEKEVIVKPWLLIIDVYVKGNLCHHLLTTY